MEGRSVSSDQATKVFHWIERQVIPPLFSAIINFFFFFGFSSVVQVCFSAEKRTASPLDPIAQHIGSGLERFHS